MSPGIHQRDGDPPPTEGVVLSNVERALEAAVEDLGLDPTQSSVKREKYVYLTVEAFTDPDDHPITYSWFRWGVSTLAGPGGATSSETLVTDSSGAETLLHASHEELVEFLESGDHELPLSEWWEAAFYDFLEHFYASYAPAEYRDLYLANVRLLRLLDDVRTAVQLGRNPVVRDTYRRTCELTSTLRREVAATGGLRENDAYVAHFADLLEDAMLALESLPEEDLETGHHTAISELEDFYRENVWLMVAHSASKRSAVGPNVEAIYRWSATNLERLRAEYEDVETKAEICAAMGLLRDFREYPDFAERGRLDPAADDGDVEPLPYRVLADEYDDPAVQGFVADADLAELADSIDLLAEYAAGDVSHRTIAETLSIDPATAYALIEELLPRVADVPEPETVEPGDVDDERRDDLLADSSDA